MRGPRRFNAEQLLSVARGQRSKLRPRRVTEFVGAGVHTRPPFSASLQDQSYFSPSKGVILLARRAASVLDVWSPIRK